MHSHALSGRDIYIYLLSLNVVSLIMRQKLSEDVELGEREYGTCIRRCVSESQSRLRPAPALVLRTRKLQVYNMSI